MKEIADYIDKKSGEVVKFAQELVRIPTVNPPGENYEKIVGVLEERCRNFGFKTKRIVVPDAELKKAGICEGSRRINLLARWNTGGRKTLHFNGHYDVVPITAGWSVAPFGGIVRNGRLYGRGSEDMKATIAAMIYAAGALKSQGIKPSVNVELSFTPDEETGGDSGLAYLVKKNIINPDYAVSEGLDGDYLSCGNKGALWLEIQVLGKSAHASIPYKAINSFEGMVQLAGEILLLAGVLSKRRTKFATKDERDKLPTMVLGGAVSGGAKVNIVPDRSSFTVDRRLLPEESLAEAKGEILRAISKFKKRRPEFQVKVKTMMSEPPVITDPSSSLCRIMLESIKRIVKKKPRLAITPGATDLRFLIKRGIPAVGYNVSGLDRCHGDDEFVYVQSLLDTAKIYALLTTNLR